MATNHRTSNDDEEESYFISMSDMMVGLVFIFVILLVYFAMQFKQTTDELAGANQTRWKILVELRDKLGKAGISVEIVERTGVLHLPGDILFAKGQADISPSGAATLDIVAKALAQVLPCYTFGVPKAACRPTKHRIDAIFIEGHTDIDPIAPGSKWVDNFDLSAMRATNVYRRLITTQKVLAKIQNIPLTEGRPVSVLSVSGYGEQRPVDTGYTEDAKTKNRRIDLRFLMASPDTTKLRRMLVDPR